MGTEGTKFLLDIFHIRLTGFVLFLRGYCSVKIKSLCPKLSLTELSLLQVKKTQRAPNKQRDVCDLRMTMTLTHSFKMDPTCAGHLALREWVMGTTPRKSSGHVIRC